MIRSSLAAAVLLTPAIFNSAQAADMALKAPPPAPAAAWNWTGLYLGLEGGGGWGSTSHTNATNAISSGINHNLDGGLFGATYGYNWQSGSLVLGVEGDISWSGLKDTFPSSIAGGFCTAGQPCFTDLRWLGTDRGRLGFAWDRYMIYATGGFAYGDVNATIFNNGGCCDSETHLRTGYAVGGGFEAMFAQNWSAKIEYLYINFGNKMNYLLTAVAPPENENVLVKFSSVRAGIDYHFGIPAR